MIQLKYIISGALFLAGTLFSLSSCSDEESARHDSSRAVVFATTVGQSASATRLAGNTWEDGDEIGVFMLEDGETFPNNATFSRYIAGGGATSALTPYNKDNTLEYPEEGNVSFVAYYPYTSVINSNVAIFDKFADQSTATLMAACDVVYSNSGDTYNKDTQTATLHFDHKFSKLVLNVKNTAGDDAIDLSKLSAKVKEMPGTGAINLSNGQVPNIAGSTDITPYISQQSATAFNAQAVVFPHLATDFVDRAVTFTLSTADGEQTATVKVDSDLDFKSGKVYTLNYTLTAKPDAIAVEPTGTTITNWTGGTWMNTYTIEASKTITVPAEAVAENVYTFKTNYTGTVSIIRSTSDTDAHAGAPTWLTEVEKPVASAPDANGIMTYTYKFGTTENETSGEQIAYLYLNVERHNLVIKVTQSGLSLPLFNCYMVESGGTVEIPVALANKFTQSISEADAIGDATVFTGEVLWMDKSGLATLEIVGTGAAGKIKVTTAKKQGNAIVAAKVDGKIVWSWHIWVTDYAPDPATDTWMEYNLGATASQKGADGSTGLYYQWGRKDPFPGSATALTATEPTLYNAVGTSFTYAMNESNVVELGSPTLVKVQKDMAWTVNNPLTFIGYDGSWMLNSTVDDTNWNSTDNQKTLFDPCPEGYRVPLNSSWGATNDWSSFAWDDGSKGRDTGSTYGGWYPAAGNRNSGTGVVSQAGFGSFYWSSLISSSTTYADYLFFSSSTVVTRYSYNRSGGYSVRCMAESD